MFEESLENNSPTVIKVVGVGGAGMNAVNRMITAGLKGVEFIAVNTDEQVLEKSGATQRIAIGQKTTRGMGAGGNPDIGYRSAMEDKDKISHSLRGADMVFITAGMGGGTGTGAAPIVAEIANDLGALVVGVITLPFIGIEGQRRMKLAQNGLAILQDKVDTLIIIKNDSIFKVVDPKTSVDLAFRMIDDILLNAVRGISDLINTAGLVNVDFADVRAIMGETGEAVMGAGEGFGEDRAAKAVNQAIHNSLLEENGIEGATAALINVCGNENLGIFELKDVAELITRHLNPQANIIIGLTIDSALNERLRVTVIATGFHVRQSKAKKGLDERKSKLVIPLEASNPDNTPYWMNYGTNEEKYMDNNQVASNEILSTNERLALQDVHNEYPTEKRAEKRNNAKALYNEADIDIPAYLRRKKVN